MLYRRDVCTRKKRGAAVGKTKRGKGSKIMLLAERGGLPIGAQVCSATPHEVTLVEATLSTRFLPPLPKRLIGDGAYDSDALDQRMKQLGINLIAPHKSNRVKEPTQDGRILRRYQRRWKVERLNAWLQNFRRLVTRFEHKPANFLGFLQFACALILSRYL